MVKVPNRPPTPVEPRPSGVSGGLPLDVCPSLELEVALVEGADLRVGDAVSAHLRSGIVQLLCRGQIVARVEDEATVRKIRQCDEAGGLYEGQVIAAPDGQAVILLEDRG